MGKTLTIIIPTYNMEGYLDYCLSSLILDDESLMDCLEVLVINDGSKDKSSEIAHRYEEKFPNTFRVIDKENGNYGSCINKGLEIASGKYVKVLDADDSFNNHNFPSFIKYLKTVDSDLVLSDFDIVDCNHTVTKSITHPYNTNEKYKFSDLYETEHFKFMQMHAVTYRTQILKDINYKQEEGIAYTDQQWIFTPMSKVESILFFNKSVYLYLIGREGQSVDPNIKNKQITQKSKSVIAISKDYNIWKNTMSSDHLKFLSTRIFLLIKSVYLSCFTNFNKKNKNELIDFDQTLKNTDSTLYEMIGDRKVSNIVGIPYIKIWRSIKSSSSLSILFSRTIVMLLLIKRSFKKL